MRRGFQCPRPGMSLVRSASSRAWAKTASASAAAKFSDTVGVSVVSVESGVRDADGRVSDDAS